MGMEPVYLNVAHWRGRSEHRRRVIELTRRFLEERSKKALVALMEELWSMDMFRNIEWVVEHRVLRGREEALNEVAEALRRLLDEGVDLRERWAVAIPGVGVSSRTEILFCHYPDRYPIANVRSVEALRRLGYWEGEGVPGSYEEYRRFVEACERFVSDYIDLKRKIEERLGEGLPRFEFADGIFNLLYEGRVSEEELRAGEVEVVGTEELEGLCREGVLKVIERVVRQYFYWRQRGLSHRDAVDRAVSYAFGRLESALSEVLSDPRRRRLLLVVYSVVGDLMRGLAEMMREYYSEG